eukprot:TRINITY_DN4695_c0_g1_i3.p1 TRINITY_DN4695_c0_g1~~TRINITY_DN4695_c0_g1_i3.p1  ORF type:complete len:235 (-),score=20.69 TRINITY_DN4695_c0_g1_i3:167-781(-)
MSIKIGVLALQGAFIEHIKSLQKIPDVEAVEIRTPEELADPDLKGLILPGGESTAIGLVASRWGLVEPLQRWIQSRRPIWGTCAGLVLMANRALGQKQDGQPLLGGLDVLVNRNHFGSQIASFETDLVVSSLGEEPFRAVFIRAPAILEVGPSVQVLAEYESPDKPRVIVAAKQDNILVTSFHPELTQDARWHQYFIDLVRTQS